MSDMASPTFSEDPPSEMEPKPHGLPPSLRRDSLGHPDLNIDDEQKNLGMILDVILNVSVELGRARMTVRQVLDLDQDSVIELDRLAGEVVDVFINEHLIARGEVVVVDDKFGVRISELIAPTKIAESFGG